MGDPSRRQFLQGSLAVAGVGVLSGCGLARPQPSQPVKTARIGFLAAYPAPSATVPRSSSALAFIGGLRELGWIDGQNVTVEYRYAEFRDERLPDLAAELVGLGVDVMVPTTTQGVLAAKQVNATVPIVMPTMLDPVGTGLVASLGRPGGNVTGLSFLGPVLSGKRLELLKEAIPFVASVAVLWNAGNPGSANDFAQTQVAAGALGLELRSQEVHSREDFEGAFAAIMNQRPDALVVLPENLTGVYRRVIVDFAAATRLPAMYGQKQHVADGGFMAYGPDADDLYRRAATYVDKILKGAKPADLPVEQPTKFDFVINLKTAQALRLTIPQSVLQQATEIIQ